MNLNSRCMSPQPQRVETGRFKRSGISGSGSSIDSLDSARSGTPLRSAMRGSSPPRRANSPKRPRLSFTQDEQGAVVHNVKLYQVGASADRFEGGEFLERCAEQEFQKKVKASVQQAARNQRKQKRQQFLTHLNSEEFQPDPATLKSMPFLSRFLS